MIKKNQYRFECRLWVVFDFKCCVYFKLCDAAEVGNGMQFGTQSNCTIHHHRLIEFEISNPVIDHHFDIMEFSNLIPEVGDE